MAIKYLGDYNPDGTCVGRAAADKVGFYGTTPAIQPTDSDQAAWASGFTTTLPTNTVLKTAVEAGVTLVNQIRSDLVTLGLIKGS